MIEADNTWALFAIIAAIAAAAIWMEQRFNWASRITGCVLALLIAMLLSNTGVIPAEAQAYDFVWDYVVPMAVPLLLFTADIRKIRKESGRLIIIYLISGAGTVLGGIIACMSLRAVLPDFEKVTPMMIGTYTGGSVNLVAMADAFAVRGELVSASIVADNLIMAFYFFVLVMIPASGILMRHYSHPLTDASEKAKNTEKGASSYWRAKPVSLMDVATACSVSLLIVALSTSLAAYFSNTIPKTGFVMNLANGMLGSNYLIITTITLILATLFPSKLGNIGGAQEIGTFFIHIFFAVIGVPASFHLIITKSPLLILFCLIIVMINLAVTLLFGKVLKFSIEEIIIASNANIGGPTTAAAMAIAKGWGPLIVPAILVGTLGYVLGNYYGVFVGAMLGIQ